MKMAFIFVMGKPKLRIRLSVSLQEMPASINTASELLPT
jgi:hypothetical protein